MTSTLKVDQIQNVAGNTGLQLNSAGLVMPQSIVFQVKGINTAQSFQSLTKVQWTSVELDSAGYWDSTNHRFSPQTSGWYFFWGALRVRYPTINQYIRIIYSKNGYESEADERHLGVQYQFNGDYINNGTLPLASGLLYMNGSSDYVEVQVEGDETMEIHHGNARASHFGGMLIHKG